MMGVRSSSSFLLLTLLVFACRVHFIVGYKISSPGQRFPHLVRGLHRNRLIDPSQGSSALKTRDRFKNTVPPIDLDVALEQALAPVVTLNKDKSYIAEIETNYRLILHDDMFHTIDEVKDIIARVSSVPGLY